MPVQKLAPIPGLGRHNEAMRLSSVLVRVPDADDSQIWLQSSISPTHRLPRGTREEFSFSRDSLSMLSNRGGDLATVVIDCTKCGESGICIGSNRRGACLMREGQRLKLRLRAGEVLTLRSLDAIEPGSKDSEGRAVALRPGQGVVIN